MPCTRLRAFTLLELLVVITIIVALLTMLAPALDRAVYEADLAVCSGNFNGMGTAAVAYATAHRRFYPQRKTGYVSNAIVWGAVDGPTDERPMFRTMFNINQQFHDPFAPKVDFETRKSAQGALSDPHMYFGFRYTGEQGLIRLGHRLTWRGVSVSVLAADQDQIITNTGAGWATASHPDINTGRMVAEGWQDSERGAGGGLVSLNIQGQSISPATTAGTAAYYTFSYWIQNPGWQRGPLDLNYLFIDGSVVRYRQVTYNDSRMWMFPTIPYAYYPTDVTTTDGIYTPTPKD